MAINKYTHDTENEIKFLQNKLQEKGINLSLVESWEKGGEGAEDLAQKIVDLAQEPTNFKFAYELSESIESKIKAVAQKIYGAEDVEFTDKAKQHIEEIKKWDMKICLYVLQRLNILFLMIRKIWNAKNLLLYMYKMLFYEQELNS